MPPTYDIAQAKQAVLAGDQSYFDRIIPPFSTVDPTGASPPSRRSGTTAVVLPAPRAHDARCTVFSLKDIAYYNFYSVTHSGGLDHTPFTIAYATGTERPVPDVHERTRSMAQQLVLAAGLTPAFTGSGPWVFSQSPRPGIWVPEGSTVTMTLRSEGRK